MTSSSGMVLTEIPVNSPGMNGKGPAGPVTTVINAYADNASDTGSVRPSSIHSMLRNTTETGDIGRFSIVPAHTQSPISQITPRSSSFPPYIDDLPPHQMNQLTDRDRQRQRRGGGNRQNSLQSYQGTTASSIISLYQSDSQKSSHHCQGHIENNGRTFSISQSSQVSHSLSAHRSDGTTSRPRSPFAYPTRLKRPGHRPSSPALTEVDGRDIRANHGLNRGLDYRTPSPFLTQADRRLYHGFHPALNRSMPSLPRQFSSLERLQLQASTIAPQPGLVPAIRSVSGQDILPLPLGRGSQVLKDHSPWPRPQVEYPIPLYYDYSEAFEDRHVLSSSLSNLPINSQTRDHEAVSQTYPEYYEIPIQMDPAEPSAPDTHSDTCLRDHEHRDSRSSVTTRGTLPHHSSDEKDTEKPGTLAISSLEVQLPESQPDIETQEKIVFHQNKDVEEEQIAISDTVGHHILSSTTPEARDRVMMDTRDTTDDIPILLTSVSYKQEADQGSEILRMHSNRSPISSDPIIPIPYLEEQLSPLPWKVPNIDFGRLGLAERTSSSPSDRADISTIQAPKPERSMSSRTSRNCFSRILSIDEGFADLARAVMDSGLERASEMPMATSQAQVLGDAVERESKSNSGHDLSLSQLQLNVSSGMRGGSSIEKQFEAAGSYHDQWSSRIASKDITEAFKAEDTSYGDNDVDQREYPQDKRSSNEHRTNSNPRSATSRMAFSTSTIHDNYRNNDEVLCSIQDSHECSSALESAQDVEAPQDRVLDQQNMMGLLEAASIVPWEYDDVSCDRGYPIARYKLKSKSDGTLGSKGQDSTQSLPDSTGAYTSAPKFKLKVTRASSSTDGTVRVRRQNSVSTFSLRPSFAPIDVLGTGPARPNRPLSSIGRPMYEPLMSHAVFPTHAHFKEQLDGGSGSVPQIHHNTPSPNLNFGDTQSYFSNDSSHIGQKTSLRQRLSSFKAAATRADTADDVGIGEKTKSRRASGRQIHNGRRQEGRQSSGASSQGHTGTEGMSSMRHRQRKVKEMLKDWWHRSEKKVRDVGKKMKRKNKRGRKKGTESTSMYDGV